MDAINRLTAMHGNQTKVSGDRLPKPIRELVEAEIEHQKLAQRVGDKPLKEQMAEIDRRMGWS